MALKAGRVGVNRSDVDELGHVTSGGLTPEERAKLDKALVAPITAPTENELVGIGTANDEILVKIGDGLTLDGSASPYTLKAESQSGGGSLSAVWVKIADNKSVTHQTSAQVLITTSLLNPLIPQGYELFTGDVKSVISVSANNVAVIPYINGFGTNPVYYASVYNAGTTDVNTNVYACVLIKPTT